MPTGKDDAATRRARLLDAAITTSRHAISRCAGHDTTDALARVTIATYTPAGNILAAITKHFMNTDGALASRQRRLQIAKLY